MEKLIAELNAKSLKIESLECSLFFSWEVFTKSKQYGVVIDANALSDPARNLVEATKLIYLCCELYTDVATKLCIDTPKAPSLSKVEAWVALCPQDFASAVKYITSHLGSAQEKSSDVKKNSQNESCKNQIPLSWIRRLYHNFCRGSAN